jgi:cytochrome c553
MKKLLILIISIISIAFLLYSITKKAATPIPADVKHIITTDEGVCFGCHENNEDMPLKKEHTSERNCFECHKRAEKPGAGTAEKSEGDKNE